jgi:1-phosphofructokinase
MIYTVTFNPAIDYVVHIDNMKLGAVNRSVGEEMYFGGKGINVSVVLNHLGVPSKALGFVAGFTGEAIEKGISAMGIETDFISLKNGNSRINVKVKSGLETELNGQGPDIGQEELEKLFGKIDELKDGDTLILAGSIPSSLPSDVYEKIMERLQEKNIKIVVDATKQLLLNVLKYHPFLIKPNNHELGELFGVTLNTREEILEYAKKVQDMGARNVLVSLAGDGAILLDENKNIHSCGVCKGTVKNSVGAGDSMVAGFVAGSMDGDYEYALKLGTACGGATAFSEGLAEKEYIMQLLGQL